MQFRLMAESRRQHAARRFRALAIGEFAELYGDDSNDDYSDDSRGSDLVSSETEYARDSDYD